MTESEKLVTSLLAQADIQVNGKRHWDIQVHNRHVYHRFLEGSLGVGESYMDGWWDTKDLVEMLVKINQANLQDKLQKNLRLVAYVLRRKLFNIATHERAFTVGKKHYDIGNDLYTAMLDSSMNYSCGYWKDLGNLETAWKKSENLEKAQRAKIDLICRKLYLKKGERVLDIGCGWGNFARHAAEKYEVRVVGLTVSKEQASLARIRCKNLPVEIRVQDYRDLGQGEYNKIVSIGMFEHVTYKNYDAYMQIAHQVLKKDGLFLLHTIGANKSSIANDPWNEKYIFPNSLIPSMTQISKAVENKFVIEDFHNFGVDYYPTLMAWYSNFTTHWKQLSESNPEKYSQRFYNMWKFYLLASAAAFKSRNLQLWQIVLSKRDTLNMYSSIR